MSACASHQQPAINQSQEAAQYAAHARGGYMPPGPPADPWGPYVSEASQKYDVPERWIREVMRVESGGNLYQDGRLITSWVGAMGLMQVMPETYDELRGRYGLGDDAYDPHNNILAGAAYMREMYDIYGKPGFLAAYNAGPKRLDEYLSNTRPLPDETRHYVAMIGPYIMDSDPVSRSPAEDYAMNALPIDIPPGYRYGRVQVAHYRGAGGRRSSTRHGTQFAARSSGQTAPAPGQGHSGFQLVSAAVAETLPVHQGGAMSGGWAVQVGAFGKESQAHAAAGVAKQRAREPLGEARPAVVSVNQG
ncbi:MAG: lytic transglycosylase domain-containing protein, partial [Acetobacteraceae bacterium]|nr:lytic transglycosylase domain-containing protein [Acetobacteraceae bacterium]